MDKKTGDEPFVRRPLASFDFLENLLQTLILLPIGSSRMRLPVAL